MNTFVSFLNEGKFMHIFIKKICMNSKVFFSHSIWIKHARPIDPNVKFKVQLITIIEKKIETFFDGALLFDNTFKIKYLQRILDHFLITKKSCHYKIDALNREAVHCLKRKT